MTDQIKLPELAVLGQETGFQAIELSTIDPNLTTTISLSNINGTYSPNVVGAMGSTMGQPNAIWTTNNTSFNWQSPQTPMKVNQGGKIELRGEKADIDINGRSMSAWMEQVEQRLNILTPNPELETEWDELRRLGERYRKLEKKCKEKAEVWKKLKAMPPPKLD